MTQTVYMLISTLRSYIYEAMAMIYTGKMHMVWTDQFDSRRRVYYTQC